MSDSTAAIPIACNPHALGAVAWDAHQQTSTQLFAHAVESITELADGYAFQFHANMVPQIAAFIASERQCCPFFAFTMTVPPASQCVTLAITGSPLAKALLAQELVRLSEQR